jgi:MOSC domain-containing protein YiiM
MCDGGRSSERGNRASGQRPRGTAPCGPGQPESCEHRDLETARSWPHRGPRGQPRWRRSVHGGPEKAVYAYAEEEVQAWERELGRSLGEAAFGQNLTTRGIPVSDAVIGERWQIGSTVLEVAQPRQPCFKLGIRIGEPGFVKRFARASRPGAYLRIVTEGNIGSGDRIEITSRPDHGIT